MRFAPVDDAETGREGMLFGRDAFGLMTTLGIGVLVLGGLWMLLRAWRRGRDRPLVPSCPIARSEEHTSELQSLMSISYAVFCLKKKKQECEQRNKVIKQLTTHRITQKQKETNAHNTQIQI